MAGPPNKADHWIEHARLWQYFGTPLRPHPDDVVLVEAVLAGLSRPPDQALRALLLGMTPELSGCQWPANTDLTAIDRCADMTAALWPPLAGPKGARAVRGNWVDLPLRDASMDVVVGDGCYTLLPAPGGHAALGQEMRRVLKPEGRFVIRVFLRPDQAETVDAIADDLAKGTIGSIHVCKWRLAAALHGGGDDGVCIGDIWAAWQGLAPLAMPYGGRPGWTAQELATIGAYRHQDTRYYFPTLGEMKAKLAQDFTLLDCRYGTYELSERCPTLILVPHGTPMS